MRTQNLTLVVLILLVSIPTQAADDSYYRDHIHDCVSGGINPCKPDMSAESKGTFNFALYNSADYLVDTIWLSGRLTGKSTWHQLGKIGQNLAGLKVGIFSFNPAFLETKLNVTEDKLKAGFDIRLKIKSVGAGSGLEDKCKVAKVKYSDADNAWVWRKKDGSSWYKAGVGKVFLFKASGTVNSVKCALVDIGGLAW